MQKNQNSTGQNVMIFKSMVDRFLRVLLILGASVLAGGQTQPGERALLPQPGSEKYWLLVDEFADHAIHFAYAQRFVQFHEGSLTKRQCQQYARIADDYVDQLAAVKQAGVSAQSSFWNDVRLYSISMIGAPGVPIPAHRTSKYSVTTGSKAEDRELRRMVSLEIDESRSQLVWTAGYSPSALRPACRTPPQDLTAQARR